MCNIEANIEYFAFLNCFNLTFSQIEIIIKFLKNWVKKGLNFSYMALCELFSWLLSCIAETSVKIKTRITCEIFETKYINTSFQVANRIKI